MRQEFIRLTDGTIVQGDAFEKKDFLLMQKIFKDWLEMNKELKQLGGRSLNVPDVFSEALFCLAFDAVRTNGTAYSYDCVMRKTHEGVQVKSASIPNDCTSFGPTSTWDLLFFADFVPHGTIDGEVWFYRIEDNWVYPLVLNSKKHETFKMQQEQGRRPRFSIQGMIIKPKRILPVKKINLITGSGISF